MVTALKAKDTLRLNVIRGLLSSFTNEMVSKKRKPDDLLSDEESLAVIGRAVKQRKDSIEQFEHGGRTDLAFVEKAELSILETYLPVQMSREEIEVYVKAQPLPPVSEKNKFMGLIMKELKGKVDGSLVKDVVDNLVI
jgi:uncharacterized protein YqeY